MSQNQQSEEEISASGALASELGSVVTDVHDGTIGLDANPSVSAGPSLAGIPFVSTNTEESALPPVADTAPSSPLTPPTILRQFP